MKQGNKLTCRNALAVTAPAISLCLAAQVCGAAESSPTPATTVATPDAAPAAALSPTPAKSAGLANDWLRAQSPAFAPWDVGGQFRSRFEAFENGDPSAPNGNFQRSGVDNDNDYLWLRGTFHLGFRSPWFQALAEGRTSHSIGDEDPRNPGQDPVDLHQAHVTLGDAAVFPLTARIGRQELSYGDDRLIGASDWSNTGRVFDAARVRFEQPDLWVDGFAGRVVLPDAHAFDQPSDHDWLFGIYGSSRAVIPIQETQLYFLSRNVSPGGSTSPRDIYSIGTRVHSLPGKLDGWDYTVEVVGQFGSINQGGVRRVQQAFATAVSGGHTWTNAPATPRLGIEYDFSTGDSDPNDGTNETLDNLFPTNHSKYGLMDLIGWRNIHDIRFSLSGKPVRGLTVTLEGHCFWLADTDDLFYPQSGSGRNGNGFGRNPGFDSFVGSEIDLDVAYTVTQWTGVRAGYGHFFTGAYVGDSKLGVGGAVDADWYYLQAVLSF